MLHRLTAKLADDTGSLLVDAMVGIIVSAITLIGLSTLAVATSNALTVTASQKQRQSYAASYVSDQAMAPLSVPTTPTTSTEDVDGTQLPVTLWRVNVDGQTSVISAAMPRLYGAAGDCTDPATARAHSCIMAQVTVPVGDPGIVTTSMNSTWTDPNVATPDGAAVLGPVGSFIVPAGTTEVRYVVLLSGATGNSQLTFSDGTTVLASIPYTDGTNSYFYGSLTVDPGATVTIATTGTAARLAHFYLYQAAS